MKVPKFDKHLKKAGGHIGRNVVEITIKMKTIVRKPLMIKKKLLVMKLTKRWNNFFDVYPVLLASIWVLSWFLWRIFFKWFIHSPLFLSLSLYIYIVNKLADGSQGQPECSLFNSFYTEVLERALLLSLDCSTYSWSIPYNV